MSRLYRNTAAGGAVEWFPTELAARKAARIALLQGSPPFRLIAEPVTVPSGSRKLLAAWLNAHGAA